MQGEADAIVDMEKPIPIGIEFYKDMIDAGEKYGRHMGRYPVIFLTLKSAKQPNYQMAYDFLVNGIAERLEEAKLWYDGFLLGILGAIHTL